MTAEQDFPKDEGLDHTVKLLQEGYQFIINRKDRFDSNVFETTILGENAICLIGKEAAELFYDRDKFKRENAAPKRAEKTLFGEGGVQGLDGEAHRHRKAMFMSLMTKESLAEIRTLTDQVWKKAAKNWKEQEDIVLYEETKMLLTEVACKWTGIPFEEERLEELSQELGDMFEKAANVGPKHWRSRRSRSKKEDWVGDLVEQVRSGELQVDHDRALYRFSMHKDSDGELLDQHTAAVELLNLLRPIVAVSVYIAFCGLAFHQYPQEVEKIRTGDQAQTKRFIQEVRRYYPFFPFAIARVKNEFSWEGFTFKENTLTLLDLYGTNHHPQLWDSPDRFDAERFKTWSGSPFDFIPQGGGEYDIGHRCAGEWITLDILQVSVDYLANKLSFEVPEQDLDFNMNDIPSLPKSKMILSQVKER